MNWIWRSQVVVAVLLAGSLSGRALDVGYTQASGDWATDTNWVGGAKPSDGDRALIGGAQMGGMANAADVSVTTDESGVILGDVCMSTGSSAESKAVLRVQTGANLLSQGTLHISTYGTNTIDAAFPGVASVVYQRDGVVEFGQIAIGGSTGGKGAYELTGGTIHNHRIYIGHSAAGTLIQTGGQITGYNGNNNWGNLEVGISQPATYMQSGGSNELNELFIGGNYILSGGTNTVHGRYLVGINGPATVMHTGGDVIGLTGTSIGDSQPTVYNHSGGSVRVLNGELWIGNSSTLSYNLSGTGVLEGSVGRTIIGAAGGLATVSQNGGTATLGELHLGWEGAGIGSYNLSGGTLNARSITLQSAESAFRFLGGTLSVGTIQTNLANRGGVLAPGQTNGLGKTQINGRYTAASPAAGLQAQLGGTTPGVTHDWLSVSGSATLGGSLIVDLESGFTPAGGDTFMIVTAAAVEGVFANAPVSGERYDLGGGSFLVTYGPGAVTLSGYQAAAATQVDNDGGATEVGATTAKIRGTLLTEGSGPTACRFLWWADGDATTNLVAMGARAVGETFTNALATLNPGTTYYYRTAASNASGDVVSATTAGFTTLGPPQVANLAPANVNTTTAIVRGMLTGVSTGEVTIFYWIDGEATTNAAPLGAQPVLTPCSANLSGLTPLRWYHYRCYATNEYGEAWASGTTNFFTQSPTTDWRWSTRWGGDYNVGTNYNGGNQVALPPASGNSVYIGIDTYPSARHNNRVTIDAPSYGGSLWVGHSGTNNQLTIAGGGSLNLSGELRVSEGTFGSNRVIQSEGLVQTHGGVYVAMGGTGSYTLDGGELRSHGYSMFFGYGSRGTLTQAPGTTIDTCTTPGNPAGGGGDFRIGNGGAGASVWSFNGGQVLVGGSMQAGVAPAATPVVNQASGTRLAVNGFFHPGHTGISVWNQNGGTNTVSGEFRMGDGTGVGTYNLNAGVLTVNGGTAYLGISGASTSVVNQAGGSVSFAGTLHVGWGGLGVYNLSNGTLRVATLSRNAVPGSGLNVAGGVLSADTVNFDLINGGGVLAMGGTNATGKTQVNGGYAVSSTNATLQVELGGTGQGTTYDWLNATGAVALNGNLAVALVNGFTPGGGDTFTVVTGSSVSGTFANAPVSGTRYNLGHASAVVTYEPSAVTLSQVFGPGTHVANTGGATAITGSSAKLRGSVLIDTAPPTTVKVFWWPVAGGVTNSADLGVQAEGVVFTNAVNGLGPRTQYAYRCYATNSSGEVWAPDIATFTTWLPDVPGGVESIFQDGANGYLGTQDTSLPAGAGQGGWTPGYQGELWVGQDFFFANAFYAHDQIPPHEADDWRPRRSIVRFDMSSLATQLVSGVSVARVSLMLTRVGGSGTYANTPVHVSALPDSDGGWREGVQNWDDFGAACWNWKALGMTAWSGAPDLLVASNVCSSTDTNGTVYEFTTTNTDFMVQWITNAEANAGFRITTPVIEYGDPGYQGINFASSEHETTSWRPLLSVVLARPVPSSGYLILVK